MRAHLAKRVGCACSVIGLKLQYSFVCKTGLRPPPRNMQQITIRKHAFCLLKPMVLPRNMQHFAGQYAGFCKNMALISGGRTNRKQRPCVLLRIVSTAKFYSQNIPSTQHIPQAHISTFSFSHFITSPICSPPPTYSLLGSTISTPDIFVANCRGPICGYPKHARGSARSVVVASGNCCARYTPTSPSA